MVVLRSAVFLFHFRFNTAGQGWGPSSSWDGSEPPLLPSLWLDDFPGVHPTKSLRCSSGWGHPSGRPAPPPAGQICCWCSTSLRVILSIFYESSQLCGIAFLFILFSVRTPSSITTCQRYLAAKKMTALFRECKTLELLHLAVFTL